MGKDIKDLKIVTCHLGQGSSICAVQGGKSVDTSMGLTPLAGIPMVTRSGDLDPSVVTYLMKKENMSVDEIESVLNKKSGVQGISGLAPDFREIEAATKEGNERAQIAIEKFMYEVASYVAKYAAAMNGVDYIVFTGGVGENQINIRKGICEKLEFMGVKVDTEANNMRGEEKEISAPDSLFKIVSFSSAVHPSFFIKYVTTDGSKSPERVPIGIPPSGVNPILVSTEFPFFIAQILAPCPKWQFTILSSLTSFPNISATLYSTY